MSYRKEHVKLVWNNNFAYIIGVITTDGNLSSDLRHLIITSKDYEMVTNCKKYLESIIRSVERQEEDQEIKNIICFSSETKTFLNFC